MTAVQTCPYCGLSCCGGECGYKTEEDRPRFFCHGCNTPVYRGDFTLELDGFQLCEECVNSYSGVELAEFLGHQLKEVF